MGVKASNLMWCEYKGGEVLTQPASNILPRQAPDVSRQTVDIWTGVDKQQSSYLNFHTVPSYNHCWTDLHYAASHGNVRRIHEIIHKNGTLNINKKDYYGKTPLYWAAYKGHIAALAELIRFGAEVNTRCRHGGTPLHSVVSLHPECALLLIKSGADVNVMDNWGVTPMFLAASAGQVNVIRYLITAGAKLSFKNLKTGDIPKELLKHKEFCDTLIATSQTPPTLQQLCRVTIRSNMRGNPALTLNELKLPRPLKDYVLLKELV